MPVKSLCKLKPSKPYGLHALHWLCFQNLLHSKPVYFRMAHAWKPEALVKQSAFSL